VQIRFGGAVIDRLIDHHLQNLLAVQITIQIDSCERQLTIIEE
jgi:hypothetical protein